jgi:hypothetical protein
MKSRRDKCGAIAVLPGRLGTMRLSINLFTLSLVVGPEMAVSMTSSVMEENLRKIWEIV